MYQKQTGFSLIEILISMGVFLVGFVGIAQFTGEGLKNISDNNSRAMSLNTMTQLLTPLYVAAAKTPTDFKNALDLFSAQSGVSINANHGRETYTVKILEAMDDSGLLILGNSSPNTWQSPITVGVTVSYIGTNSLLTSRAPYTFQLTD